MKFCKNSKYILCNDRDAVGLKCLRCGWDRLTAAGRRKEIQVYGLSVNKDGLRYYHINQKK